MVDGSRVLVVEFVSSECWVGARGRPIGFGSGGIHSRGWLEIVVTVGGGSGWTSYLEAAPAGATHFVWSRERESRCGVWGGVDCRGEGACSRGCGGGLLLLVNRFLRIRCSCAICCSRRRRGEIVGGVVVVGSGGAGASGDVGGVVA